MIDVRGGKCPRCNLRPSWDLRTSLCGACYLLVKAWGGLEVWEPQSTPAVVLDHRSIEFDRELSAWRKG